ncbi:unnamed protein product [Trichobilharzia regenti]|nr:unnamed protein product [Trichobilharzia regenti]
MGNRVVKLLGIKDHSVHNRHLDQLKINEVGRSNYNFNYSVNNPDFVDSSEVSPDNTDENNITESRSIQHHKPVSRYTAFLNKNTLQLMSKIGQGIQISVSWIPQKHGEYPSNAISVDKDVFVVRCKHEDEYIPGKLIPENKKCYCPYNGRELSFSKYEVLCDTSIDHYSKG